MYLNNAELVMNNNGKLVGLHTKEGKRRVVSCDFASFISYSRCDKFMSGGIHTCTTETLHQNVCSLQSWSMIAFCKLFLFYIKCFPLNYTVSINATLHVLNNLINFTMKYSFFLHTTRMKFICRVCKFKVHVFKNLKTHLFSFTLFFFPLLLV